MATVTALIRVSTKTKKLTKVQFRLSDGRGIYLLYKSEIEVSTDLWDTKTQAIKAKVIFNGDRDAFNKSITDRKNELIKAYNLITDKQNATTEILTAKLDEVLHPENYLPIDAVKQTFFEIFAEFLEKHKLSVGRRRHFEVVKRALQRFELYNSATTKRPFKLSLDTIAADTIRDIEKFLREEHTIFKTMPEIYKAVPESRTPAPRGQNTINGILTKIRTFILWSINEDKTENNPFKKFSVGDSVYGTPYYITIEERNQLYKRDLSLWPELETQRDIFVFQCLIGCRVGDLYKLTTLDVKNDFIEYIPRKTKEDKPVTVRVPLNTTAKEILKRYPNNEAGRLLPFISEQKYNKAIKDAFTMAKLTRQVTVVNPTTGEPETQPLNKIASSHLARRCFVGNLYSQVKDPNLIGELSGHVPGSKSFLRYKSSNDEMKISLVNLLD
jgi:site-specific recombinase XerD